MEISKEKIGLCALNRIFGFEPRTAAALISHMGSATEIFCLSEKEADDLLGPYSRHKGCINERAFESAYEELLILESKGISFCGYTEEGYPELLKECADAPTGLYIRGCEPPSVLFSPRRRISVIGTRDISPYGREWCSRVISGLAASPEKPVIVSGLALGTDICAHIGALDAGLPTIGVMATGPEDVYPFRHKQIAERMACTPGCALITDYPPGTSPLAIHFLRRNRIIAGLSESTVLIESKIKGGGMMTSRLAFSYGRDVYALPGRADDIRSQGCNLLIREKVAEPVTDVEGMMLSMGFGVRSKHHRADDRTMLEGLYGGRMPEERIEAMIEILKVIRKERGISIDDISAVTGFPSGLTASLTGILETDGIISIDILTRCCINPRKSELFF